jgi:N-methylhydantoinase B
VLDDEILSIILSNIRIADQRIGDIKAQAAALATGQARLGALLDRYGDATVDAADRRAQAPARRGRCARRSRPSRRRLRRRGLRRFRRRRRRAAADRDAHHQDRRQRRRARGAVVRHERLVAAVPGADEQRHRDDALVDLPRVKHVFPEAAINAGTFEPLHIVDPEGRSSTPTTRVPVSGCAAEVSQRIAEAVFAALGQAIPEQLFGAPAGPAATSASAASIRRRTAPT